MVTSANAERLALAWSTGPDRGAIDAPSVVNGKVFRVVDTGNVFPPSTFQVRSARTGSVLWTLSLPGSATYDVGLTVVPSRGLAVVPFDGHGRPGGYLVVDLVRRAVLYSRNLPPENLWWSDDSPSGRLLADAQHVYLPGSGRAVITYRLSDGRPLWSVPIAVDADDAPRRQFGIAVGSGAVFTSSADGLTAYDRTSGRKLWTAGTYGPVVVAGGRIFAASTGGVSAYSATGCGQSRCAAVWSRRLGPLRSWANVGGVSGTMLFVTYTNDETLEGFVSRLSASTGTVTWTAPAGRTPGGPVRGGDTVWFIDEYVNPDNSMGRGYMGFSAFAKGDEPLVTIPEPDESGGFQGGIAVAAGSLLVQKWGGPLLAYRVPGS